VNCEEIQRVLHGYVDGELDLVRNLEIEQHLQACSVCSGTVNQHLALRSVLRDPGLYQRAPATLEARLRASLPRPRQPRIAFPVLALRLVGVAAALAFVALLGWGAGRLRSSVPREEMLARAVVAGHIRSLQASHLLDVISDDKHTVKPWFTRQVDFGPTVETLADQGYALLGGRLDYLDDKQAAAVVYQRRKHIINLFMWPTPSQADEPTRALTRQGYHLLHWSRAGLTYWVISDLNEQELQQFVELIQR
jgi:anti-sigma factor RsiW